MRVRLFVATITLCAVSLAAHATPVTYTLAGTMSGSLGADTFTGAAVTFTFLADTANTNSLGFGFFTNAIGTGTVTVDGIGTASILSSTFTVVGSGGSAGFSDVGFNLGIFDPSLLDYDLTAPFTDTAYFVDGNFLSPVAGPEGTSLGDLIITDGDFQNPTTTFTASASGVVPEPSGLMLLGTGVVGLIGAARRRLA